MDLQSTFENLRTVGFGGIAFGGIGTFVYLRFFADNPSINPYLFIGASAAIGIALQGVTQKVLEYTFGPVFKYFSFRRKLFELKRLRERGELSEAAYNELIIAVAKQRFLE